MSHRPFDKALSLRLPSGGVFVADSVWELEEYLDLFWPRHDEELQRLMRLCGDALDGWIAPEKARFAVEAAARRRGLVTSDKSHEMLRQQASSQNWSNAAAS